MRSPLHRRQHWLPPVLVFAAVLGIWQGVATAGLIPAGMLPSVTHLIGQVLEHRGDLAAQAVPTLTATFLGIGLSIFASLLVAGVLDFAPVLRQGVVPLLVVSQTLPMIALAPLVVLWFGFGLLPKVLLVAFLTFFAMVISLLQGFNVADPQAEHLLRAMGASPLTAFRLVRFPAAIPYFFSGLRIAITYSVVAAIFAEYAGAVSGLGVYMQAAKNTFRTDLVLAAVLVSSLLTLVLFAVVTAIERFAFPWLAVERGQVS